MISKPILTKYTSRADVNARVQVNKKRIQKGMRECKNNLIFPMMDVKEYPLHETLNMSNQIMVLYKTGRFEVLPAKINGLTIRDYLGIRFHRIVMWTPMPVPGTPASPMAYKAGSNFMNPETDLYNGL